MVFAVAFLLVFGLAACSGGASRVELRPPVTVSFDEVDGRVFVLRVGEVLVVSTGDVLPEEYTVGISDTAVLDGFDGEKDDDASFNPGVKAVSPGEADVTVVHRKGVAESVRFHVKVTG